MFTARRHIYDQRHINFRGLANHDTGVVQYGLQKYLKPSLVFHNSKRYYKYRIPQEYEIENLNYILITPPPGKNLATPLDIINIYYTAMIIWSGCICKHIQVT